jgi:hypothetical protein
MCRMGNNLSESYALILAIAGHAGGGAVADSAETS